LRFKGLEDQKVKAISILGSTGSIGGNVLRVVEAFPDRFRVVGLSAGENVDVLADQIARYHPEVVSVATEAARAALGQRVDLAGVRVGLGEPGLVEVATHEAASLVVASAVGAVGLVPTYRALEAGKDVALANKETLVMAGELMVAQARARGCRILPIDSEHCALHQCLDGRGADDVRRLLLTGSGGPFRQRPRETFASITKAEALRHPTWTMGQKITIDSATLMNKGLEVIEAHWLFGVPGSRIEVLIHPQSVIHSMVELIDGTILAQLGVTDMRLPIQYALSYPERWPAAIPGLDLGAAKRLELEAPDRGRFPSLDLAYRALEGGGTLPAVLNAANEVAVSAFLSEQVPFPAITDSVAEVMADHQPGRLLGIEDALEADAWARQRAREALATRALEGALP
jgi:1-deoxy-D-xylulose-5-phosphate reductoisomerase